MKSPNIFPLLLYIGARFHSGPLATLSVGLIHKFELALWAKIIIEPSYMWREKWVAGYKNN